MLEGKNIPLTMAEGKRNICEIIVSIVDNPIKYIANPAVVKQP